MCFCAHLNKKNLRERERLCYFLLSLSYLNLFSLLHAYGAVIGKIVTSVFFFFFVEMCPSRHLSMLCRETQLISHTTVLVTEAVQYVFWATVRLSTLAMYCRCFSINVLFIPFQLFVFGGSNLLIFHMLYYPVG